MSEHKGRAEHLLLWHDAYAGHCVVICQKCTSRAFIYSIHNRKNEWILSVRWHQVKKTKTKQSVYFLFQMDEMNYFFQWEEKVVVWILAKEHKNVFVLWEEVPQIDLITHHPLPCETDFMKSFNKIWSEIWILIKILFVSIHVIKISKIVRRNTSRFFCPRWCEN